MKHFNETLIVKPGFVKTKAWGLCGTIALFIGLALVMGTTTSSADEVQPATSEPVTTVVSPTTAQPTVVTSTTQPTAVDTSTASSEATSEAVTTATSEAATTTTSEAVSAATSTASPEAISKAVSTATSEKTEDTTPSYPEVKPEPKITKDGTSIKVENPDLYMEFPNGRGIYATSIVRYHVDFPDDIVINDNDTVTVTLPKELTFPTQYTFDVTNPEGIVIGKAVADSAKNTIVTTFNDYFKKNPLNKSMNLELSVKWTAYIQPDNEYNIIIDGTTIKYHSSKEVIDVDPTRAIAKYGDQNKTDPTVIDWTLQLNYGNLWSHQVLTDYQLIDTLGPNQKLIEDSLTADIATSVSPFVWGGDAMHYLQDLKTNPTGFSFKIAKLDKLIYVHYKTKLTQTESESYNPTNHVDITYKSPDEKSQGYDASVALVNGKGDARGDYITTPAQVTFKLSKELTGRTLQNGEFTFQLKTADGTVLDTKTNDAEGHITFDPITYNQAGTYKYTVEEVKGTDEDIHYDDMKATILVAVDKDGRAYVAHTTMPEDTIFNNSVKQTTVTKAELVFNKVLHGRDLKAGEFTFNLRDENGQIVASATNDDKGKIEFKDLTFDKPGTYHYVVTEDNGSNEDIIYDDMVADVTINVIKEIGDELNSLVSSVVYPQDTTFDNTIKELKPVTTSLSFDKMLKGRDLKENEFTFALFEVTDKGEQFKGFTQNNKNGHITFGNLTFDTEGQHHFAVKEVVGNDEDVIYDNTVAKADITVTKTIHDTFNALVSNVEYGTKTFTNTIKELKGTEVTLTFHKELHGRELKDGEFMFALFEETDKGNIFYGFATNDAKGNIVFDHLDFDKPGVHNFFVQEVIGKDASVTYDDLIARATVTIEKVIGKTENSLKATVKYSDDITFDNSVKPEKPKDEKPKGDKPKGDKPKGETPKGETPKQEQYQKGNTLPNTGDEKGSALGLVGIVLSLMAVGLFGKTRKHN